MNSYQVHCECGKSHAIGAAAAGAPIRCVCGRTFDAPRLSELRAAVGEDAFARNAVEKVNQAIDEGELPGAEVCLVSGAQTSDVLYVWVQCESRFVKRRSWFTLLLMAASPFLMRAEQAENEKVFGRNTLVRIPLHIDAREHVGLRKRSGRKRLLAVLKEHPLCRDLFEDFPEAQVIDVE